MWNVASILNPSTSKSLEYKAVTIKLDTLHLVGYAGKTGPVKISKYLPNLWDKMHQMFLFLSRGTKGPNQPCVSMATGLWEYFIMCLKMWEMNHVV